MHISPRLLVLSTAAVLALAGCGSPEHDRDDQWEQRSSDTSTSAAASSSASESPSPSASSSSMAMHHKMDGGPAPAGMVAAHNAKYPVGTEVTLTADHTPDMKGAKATIVGVYSTTTYAVTYTPTDGGPKVVNHKWVVQEELAGVGNERVADGTPVTIEADHMDGMKGAQGTVVSSTTEPVYIVDYTNADGMTMKNHKWVVESEIQPAS